MAASPIDIYRRQIERELQAGNSTEHTHCPALKPLAQEAQAINGPKALALRMARLTHFIRDMIVTAFERDSASATFRDLHKSFEEALIPDLAIPQFAARCNHKGP